MQSGVRMNMLFFTSRRRHTRYWRDWSSDVCSSDLVSDVGSTKRALVEAVDDERFVGGHPEIGRGSCRERVQISVVAVSLKKKNRSHDDVFASVRRLYHRSVYNLLSVLLSPPLFLSF